MSRLIVVSNRAAIGEDTLKEIGGTWFGWNGGIVAASVTRRVAHV
ncbi:hypothetical protein [Burkholderia ubonensis]|nr:hypothetical protein [Burkholderia ubonensis]